MTGVQTCALPICTGLNSTMLRLIESVVLLTKSIGIITPLILSIVVVVALRLILYTSQPQDCIVQDSVSDPYRTWALVKGIRELKEKEQSNASA